MYSIAADEAVETLISSSHSFVLITVNEPMHWTQQGAADSAN